MIESTYKEKERVILVGVGEEYAKSGDPLLPDPLAELRLLSHTAGAEVLGTLVQARSAFDPAYCIGKGKVEELKEMVAQLQADAVIFDNDLTPAQVSNLEQLLEVMVIDRSGLILDIFAIRAKTREAKIQVELAQMKYLLPRLTRRWTHLSRQAGGIGLRGPGETQLEIDRRRVRERIGHLSEVLLTIEKQRTVSRERRRESFKAALVGYTNAGKSTLLNALSGADVPVEDKLFKTLDSVTRLVKFPDTPEMLVSDTVGFIRNLPHDLVASFKSTLAEVKDADALIHVIDATNPEWEDQERVVNQVLSDLGAAGIRNLIVFNKIDRFENDLAVQTLRSRYPEAVLLSAHTGDGMDVLKMRLKEFILSGRVTITREFGPEDGRLLSEVYRSATILETEDAGTAVRLTFTLPAHMAQRLKLTCKNGIKTE